MPLLCLFPVLRARTTYKDLYRNIYSDSAHKQWLECEGLLIECYEGCFVFPEPLAWLTVPLRFWPAEFLDFSSAVGEADGLQGSAMLLPTYGLWATTREKERSRGRETTASTSDTRHTPYTHLWTQKHQRAVQISRVCLLELNQSHLTAIQWLPAKEWKSMKNSLLLLHRTRKHLFFY